MTARAVIRSVVMPMAAKSCYLGIGKKSNRSKCARSAKCWRQNDIMKYLTKIYWSDEDEAYVAEVPALQGCISHGDTYAEAARNIEEAMEAWLESASKHQDPIPDPDRALPG